MDAFRPTGTRQEPHTPGLTRLTFQHLQYLQALVEERHVTPAAERMGIGQPAMSTALARLREVCKDVLLVKTTTGMVPSPRALYLARRLRRSHRARPVLRLRLYSRDTFVEGADQFVLRDVADDLTAVLCYDLPSNVVTVTADTLPRWGVPADELYYQALANQRRAEQRAAIEEIDVGGAIVRAMTGDSYFVASNLLLLNDFVTDEPPLGVIAAVPNRHTLVWHPIIDGSALRALDAMVVMAASLHAEGPGAISPNLYWWKDGVVRTLPTRETEEHYEFVPPDDFVDEVLEVLAERAEMN